MSFSEHEFFERLVKIIGEKYTVFPQIHLSTVLDVKKGQSWTAAFRHINGKSVDFVICDSKFLKPVLAIELDGFTHQYKKRKERDIEVERIFGQAGLPLLRFTDVRKMSDETLSQKVSEVLTIL